MYWHNFRNFVLLNATMHSAMFDSTRVQGVKTPRMRRAVNQTAGNYFLLVTLGAKKKKAWLRQWEWCERTRRSERWTTKKSRSAVVSPRQGLAMNQFLLLLNRMTARVLARNTVTCCRWLSRDCFGDVLHNIFAKERLDDDHVIIESCSRAWIHVDTLKITAKGQGKDSSASQSQWERISRYPFVERSKEKTGHWWRPSLRGLPEGRCKCHPPAGQFHLVPRISFHVNGLVNSYLNWDW